jgi:nucleotide-binding universal stress UspA family protein
MLTSVLLHLDDAALAEPVIRLGVEVARRSGARVRGLTLCDTRSTEAAYHCESAVYAVMEQSHQALAERKQEAIRVDLSRACLDAGLNFDVRRACGNPLQVLPQEARYHDLVITCVDLSTGKSKAGTTLSLGDLRDLLLRGVQPLLVVPAKQQEVHRVMLAYDGSEGSGRAIRSFLSQHIFPDAEYRLLAVGATDSEAKLALREMADYCRSRLDSLETGFVCGKLRSVLAPYAQKWQADLIVLGGQSDQGWLRRLRGGGSLGWLMQLSCGVYVAV